MPASQKPIVDLRYFEKIPNKPQEVEIIGRLKVLRDLNLPAPCLSSNWLVLVAAETFQFEKIMNVSQAKEIVESFNLSLI